MIRVLTAFSMEPDNPEKVAGDILGQLDLEHKLLKNSIGLLFGYVDFIDSGAVKALCSKLPFDVLGCTSQGFALHQAAEEIMLAVMVLTSGEAEFSAALSSPLTPQADTDACITSLYRRAAAPLTGSPSLIFMYPPLSYAVMTDRVLEALDRESGGVPVFGTISVDVTTKIRTPLSIFNGEACQDQIPLLIVTGAGKLKFFLVALPKQANLHQQAVVTGVDGNRIITLDDGPALHYLKKIGLAQEGGSADVMYAFPIEVNFHDGNPPRMFAIYSINPDGSLTCGGPIPVGSTLCISSIGSDLVLETAAHIINQIKGEWGKNKEYCGLIISACFSRNIVLPDPAEEMTLVHSQLKDLPVPYLFLYAGGEYCPKYTETGLAVNGFHQYTIIACLF
jgi:hypothetical protein